MQFSPLKNRECEWIKFEKNSKQQDNSLKTVRKKHIEPESEIIKNTVLFVKETVGI